MSAFRGWVAVEIAMMGTPATNYRPDAVEVEKYFVLDPQQAAVEIMADRADYAAIDAQL